jgi:hypothetical protein
MGGEGQGRHLSALPLLDAYSESAVAITAAFKTFACWFG